MSEHQFPFAAILEGSAQLDRMKSEVCSIVSMISGIAEYPPKMENTIIWGQSNGRAWKVTANRRVSSVVFTRNGYDLFKWNFSEGGPHFFGGVSNVVDVYEHLQDFVDGMVLQFGSRVTERVKQFIVVAERFGSQK